MCAPAHVGPSCSALSPEEKQYVRNVLLATLEEPEHPVAVQCAELIAKIARFVGEKQEWLQCLRPCMCFSHCVVITIVMRL